MCGVFKLSRSGYYSWIHRYPSGRVRETRLLKQEIESIYKKSGKAYGSPKIALELNNKGWKVSRPRVARIMQKHGWKSRICKKFRCSTTDSNHNLPVFENILNRNFKAEKISQKWVSDITYIPTGQGWLYLTTVLDLYDRKVIGWAMSTTMTTEETVIPAYKMAVKNRRLEKGLIFHSDRGVQYASKIFTHKLKQDNVIQSMSRKGNCWDNAVAESFFKILKSEMVNHVRFESLLQAKTALFEFIEIWYNRKRIHSALGYKTPQEFGTINYLKCA